ncbi:MAG: OsmC family protein [Pseudomonadota bacterium]
MGKEHHYALKLRWTGNRGSGTSHYRDYDRNHVISAVGKPDLVGSADPAFLGNPARWNPEELLLASIAACHKLWYLHLCTTKGIVVTAYEDSPTGTMIEKPNGAGQFSEVVLHPVVTISEGDLSLAEDLHHQVGDFCFIARSVNFPIRHTAVLHRAVSL